MARSTLASTSDSNVKIDLWLCNIQLEKHGMDILVPAMIEANSFYPCIWRIMAKVAANPTLECVRLTNKY